LWLSKFPSDQRVCAVIPSLHIVQNYNGGNLTLDLMDAVSDYLKISRVHTYEVATFYSMYEFSKVGNYKICICTNISCMVNGSNDLIVFIKEKLGIGFSEVTDDSKFSLKEVECLAACGGAPAVQIGNKYYEKVDREKLNNILNSLK
jgi:NADH-quinone oxidoreductase subunit E